MQSSTLPALPRGNAGHRSAREREQRVGDLGWAAAIPSGRPTDNATPSGPRQVHGNEELPRGAGQSCQRTSSELPMLPAPLARDPPELPAREHAAFKTPSRFHFHTPPRPGRSGGDGTYPVARFPAAAGFLGDDPDDDLMASDPRQIEMQPIVHASDPGHDSVLQREPTRQSISSGHFSRVLSQTKTLLMATSIDIDEEAGHEARRAMRHKQRHLEKLRHDLKGAELQQEFEKAAALYREIQLWEARSTDDPTSESPAARLSHHECQQGRGWMSKDVTERASNIEPARLQNSPG